MAAPRVLAVTPDREIRLPPERSKKRDDALRVWACHLPEIALCISRPAGVGPRLRLCVGDQLAARSDLREPDIEEIPARVILFFDAARQQPHRTETEPFAARSRRPQPHH